MTTEKMQELAVMESVHIGGSDAGRIAVRISPDFLAVFLISLVGGAGALAYELLVNARLEGIAGAVAQAQEIPAVPYFPEQYVNQAKKIEPQPPTF